MHDYSKTSNNGASEKRTTSVQRTAHLPPIDFTIDITNLRKADTSQLRTTDTNQPPMYLSQYKITSENGHKDRELYISTVAHRASHSRQRKQRRGPKTRRSHITTPPGSIPNADTSVFRTCSGGPFHCCRKHYKQQSSVYLFTVCNNCIILHILS